MKSFKKLIVSSVATGSLLLGASIANAHIVGLGWTFEGNGDITFDALHWHGNHATAGSLNIDGVDYAFTSTTWNTTSMTGLDGALVNSGYSTYDGAGTLSATGATDGYDAIVDDWLHVTVSGLAAGSHTITSAYGPGGLTSWTLDDSITTVGITTPAPVAEPASLALLGLGLAGLGFSRRKKV